MANNERMLVATVVTGGISTAYTAPSGTAVMIGYASLVAHQLSGTAGGPWSAHILIGPTAAPAVWLPLTAISARQGLEFRAAAALNSASNGIIVSASTASVFTLYVAGLEMT